MIKRVIYKNWFSKMSDLVLDIVENGSFVYAKRTEDDQWVLIDRDKIEKITNAKIEHRK